MSSIKWNRAFTTLILILLPLVLLLNFESLTNIPPQLEQIDFSVFELISTILLVFAIPLAGYILFHSEVKKLEYSQIQKVMCYGVVLLLVSSAVIVPASTSLYFVSSSYLTQSSEKIIDSFPPSSNPAVSTEDPSPFHVSDQGIVEISSVETITSSDDLISTLTESNDITILNLQSRPIVGGNWIIRFITVGTDDLIITGINGTTFGSSTPDDLKFLQLNNGPATLSPEIQGNSIIYRDYSSTTDGFVTSQVLTSGEHHLEFRFGNDVEYAHNFAVGDIGFLFEFSSADSAHGSFLLPEGIAVDNNLGRIIVADTGNDVIQVFNSLGILLFEFGSSGTSPSQFNTPVGVAIDSSGNIIVVDSVNNRVQVFDSAGSFILEFGGFGTGDGKFDFPIGVAVDSSDNIYVADASNSRIQIFNSAGDFLTAFGEPGFSAPGEFDFPHDVAVDSSDNIYVVDSDNDRIQIFEQTSPCPIDKELLTPVSGICFLDEFSVTFPLGVAVDSSGNIYVSDGNLNRVQVFGDFSGTPIFDFDSSITASTAGGFLFPHDVVVDSSGNVYVTNTDNDIIEVYGAVVPLDVDPFDLAVNEDTNKIYVTGVDLSLSDGRFQVIDGSTDTLIPGTNLVGDSSIVIDVNQVTNKIYVVNSTSKLPGDQVVVINGIDNSEITRIQQSASIIDIAINEATNTIYLAQTDDFIFAFSGDTDTEIDQFGVERTLSAIAVNERTNKLYVVSDVDNIVEVYDGSDIGGGVLAGINFASFLPIDIAINEITNLIYVAGSFGDVAIIDGSDNSVIATISISGGIQGIVVSECLNRVYVANNDFTISIIENVDLLGTTSLGVGAPETLDINEETRKLYVLDFENLVVKVLGIDECPTLIVPPTGGPDFFGYTYIDSNDDGGPTFEGILGSSSVSGHQSNDDVVTDLSIGFTFNYYGVDFTTVGADINGLLHLGSGAVSQFSNDQIGSSTSFIENFIAPLWMDLDYFNNQESFFSTTGTAPNRQFVVSWEAVESRSTNTEVTFAVILFEGSNEIKFEYSDIVFNGFEDFGGVATVGIEGPDGRGLQYSFLEPALSDRFTILFSPPDPIPTNFPPLANDDIVTALPNDPVLIDVLANDVDVVDGDTLTVIDVTVPLNGAADLDSPSNVITYTPNSGFGGFDFFNYTISDGNGGTDTATVTVGILQPFRFNFTFGSFGSGDGQFSGVEHTAVDSSGNIYAVDFGNDRIQVFDSSGNFQFKFGGFGSSPSQFTDPEGIAVDNNLGRIIVADTGNNRTQVFDLFGAFQFEFDSSTSSAGVLSFPTEVAVDSSGNIYVTDWGNDRIQVFDSSGNFQFEFGSLGSDPGEFDGPEGIEVDNNLGRIIVADTGNNRIQVFDLSGTFILKFGRSGSSGNNGNFNEPSSIAIESSTGNIYVADLFNDVIQVFSSNGIFLRQFGAEEEGTAGYFDDPDGVTFDNNLGRIIVSDDFNDRIQVFETSRCTPDDFGYICIDSKTPGGPEFGFVDIASAPTEITELNDFDDKLSNAILIGFPFEFYGEVKLDVKVDTNGLFLLASGVSKFFNEPIGFSDSQVSFIAPFWDDLTDNGPGTIYADTIGDEPNRKFIVQWSDFDHFDTGPSQITFEVILFEGSNNIEFHYLDVDFEDSVIDNGVSATVGIEGPDSTGLLYSFNEPALSNNFTILFSPPGPSPAIISVVASDPDSSDSFYSDFDTITVTFSIPTNQPFKGTTNSLTKTDLLNLFTFSQNLGDSFTGTWFDASTLVITTVDSSGSTPPAVGVLTVTVNADANLRDAALTSKPSTATGTLTGSFGSRAGPFITALVADDPDGGSDTEFSDSDTITVRFSESTNEPFKEETGNLLTKGNLLDLFEFEQNLGLNFIANWTNPSTLVITIVDSTGSDPPELGVLTLTVKDTVVQLRDVNELSTPSVAISPVLTGSFGIFSVVTTLGEGGTASTTLPSGVVQELTLPADVSATVNVTRVDAAVPATFEFLGETIDIDASGGCSVDPCTISFIFLQDDLDAAGLELSDVTIFRDINEDGDFQEDEAVDTVVTGTAPGPFTATATESFGSKFAIGGVAALALGALAGGGGLGNAPSIGDSTSNVFSPYKGGFGVTVDFDLNDPDATAILSVGDRLVIRLDLYENQGINNIEHITLYLSELENHLDNLLNSETFITFEKNKPLLVEDPEGFFNKTSFDILQRDAFNFVLKYDIEFAAPMDYSDILLYMWDGDRNIGQKLFEKAVKVIAQEIINSTDVSSESLEILESGTTPETSELRIEEPPTAIPDWIKSNARWWNEDQITDMDFAKGIEYLIKNGIIVVPPAVFEEQEQTVETIPDWVKSSAGWWGNGLLTDQDFVNGIQWLISKGIITI